MISRRNVRQLPTRYRTYRLLIMKPGYGRVPLAGLEPAHTAPEADALSAELQGLEATARLTAALPRECGRRRAGSAGGEAQLREQPPGLLGVLGDAEHLVGLRHQTAH